MAKDRRKSSAGQRAITRGKIRKLQRAGLLSREVNPNKPPSRYVKSQLYRYRGVIVGKQAAVKVSSSEKAAQLRERLDATGRGKTIVLPRQKGQRFRVTRGDVIKSTIEEFGQRVETTVGEKFGAPPQPGERVYYVLPRRRRGQEHLRRTVFSSFAEMMKSLESYHIDVNDVKDYIEVVRTKPGSRRADELERKHTEQFKQYRKRRRK